MSGPMTQGVGNFRPTPAIINRQDRDNGGQWDIRPCAPMRGAPMTIMHDRQMVVPMSEGETERVIRAHEMMHTKVSPDDWKPYVDRGLASFDALQAAEEAKVNFLATKAGFDMSNLDFPQDAQAGQALTQAKDWRGLVFYMAAVHGVGGWRRFVNAVKAENPDWAKLLMEANKRLKQMIRTADQTGKFTSTKTYQGGFLEGMVYTEEIAAWLDELAGAMDEPEQGDPDMGVDNEPRPAQNQPAQPNEEGEKKVEQAKEKINQPARHERKPALDQDQEARERTGKAGEWKKLVWAYPPLNAIAPGGIGVKKVAAVRGRNPRRIQRALTDPHRRIFDHKIKASKGGVVVCDVSGSMQLTTEDVRRLVAASPGCTVLAYGIPFYTTGMVITEPNVLVLAKKGRMVKEVTEEMLKPNGGQRTNGVDKPVLDWALKNSKTGEPVLFVSDGEFHFGAGNGQGHAAQRAMHKVFAKEKRTMARKTVSEAVEALEALNARQKPYRLPRGWGAQFRG